MEGQVIRPYAPIICDPLHEVNLVSRFRASPDVVTYFASNPSATLEIPVVWYDKGVITAWTQVISRDGSTRRDVRDIIDTGIIGRIVDTAYGVTPPGINVWLNPSLSIPNVVIQQARINDTYSQVWADSGGCHMMDFVTIPGLDRLPIYPTLGAIGYRAWGSNPSWPYMITRLRTHSYYRHDEICFVGTTRWDRHTVSEEQTPEVYQEHTPVLPLRSLFGARVPRSGDCLHWGEALYGGEINYYERVYHSVDYMGEDEVRRAESAIWMCLGMTLNNGIGNFTVPLREEESVADAPIIDGKLYNDYVADNYYTLDISPLIIERMFEVTQPSNTEVSGVLPVAVAIALIKIIYGGSNVLPSAWLACQRNIRRL